jgi:hypothetical protein
MYKTKIQILSRCDADATVGRTASEIVIYELGYLCFFRQVAALTAVTFPTNRH